MMTIYMTYNMMTYKRRYVTGGQSFLTAYLKALLGSKFFYLDKKQLKG